MKKVKMLLPSLLVFGALSVPSFAHAASDSVLTSVYDMVTSDGKVISTMIRKPPHPLTKWMIFLLLLAKK
ncbi:hypothetical protein ABEX69_18905 [Bacillus safensis]|uniref:hypothetical protein n=1 Tax=Bacillus safensis TaxID=561879 RepID=UPI00227DB0CD|nr:hypothetical protein [Bacillus safensis]MCY7566146.1 hypothetical protein [Bacillus safensis]MCY7623967.1 hypothetical protein [Bacillus safensis]MCY7631457.1 hypothetical protein [Bacillus safensis]MCY7648317.1 hypothetical protein [Bacillus safensis]MCY7654321.1 hypothetical protein [Bacillus safensis]